MQNDIIIHFKDDRKTHLNICIVRKKNYPYEKHDLFDNIQ